MNQPPPELDPLIHDQARLRMMSYLAMSGQADSVTVAAACGLSRTNVANHAARLVESGYITIASQSGSVGRPRMILTITSKGASALGEYTGRWMEMVHPTSRVAVDRRMKRAQQAAIFDDIDRIGKLLDANPDDPAIKRGIADIRTKLRKVSRSPPPPDSPKRP